MSLILCTVPHAFLKMYTAVGEIRTRTPVNAARLRSVYSRCCSQYLKFFLLFVFVYYKIVQYILSIVYVFTIRLYHYAIFPRALPRVMPPNVKRLVSRSRHYPTTALQLFLCAELALLRSTAVVHMVTRIDFFTFTFWSLQTNFMTKFRCVSVVFFAEVDLGRTEKLFTWIEKRMHFELGCRSA